LLSMCLIIMLCWYPLFILTLVDVQYNKHRYLYRILTVIAWSHSALTPLPLLLVDKSYRLCHMIKLHMNKYNKPGVDIDYSPDPRKKLLVKDSRESSLNATPNMSPNKARLVTKYTGTTGNNTSYLTQCTESRYRPAPSYGSITAANHYDNHKVNRPARLNTQTLQPMIHQEPVTSPYNKLCEELHTIGSPMPGPYPLELPKNLQTCINQSRETDLLYEQYDVL